MSKIYIKGGKVWIDHGLVLSRKFRQPFKNVLPGVNYSGNKLRKWWAPATPEVVGRVNLIFKTKLKLNEKKQQKIEYTKFFNTYKDVFRTELREAQKMALAASNLRPFFGYWMEPGIGKTKTIIDEVEILHRQRKVDSVVVVCPKSVITTWIEQIMTHGWYKSMEIYAWPEYHKKPEATNVNGSLRWFIINPDMLTYGLDTMKERGRRKKMIVGSRHDARGFEAVHTFLMGCGSCMMVVDESGMIANPESLRSQQMLNLRKACEYRRCLNGTPIGNAPIDVYGQLKFLSPECVDFLGYWEFRDKFCIMGGYKGRQIIGYKDKDRLRSILRDHGFRCRTRDVMDVTEPQYQVREIELTKKTMKFYNDLVEQELVPIVDGDERVSVNSGGKKFLKLAQVCGGTILDDEGEDKKWHEVGKEKVNELLKVLKEIGSNQALIWCQYVAEIEVLYKVLTEKGYEAGTFYGGLPDHICETQKSEFLRGKKQILILQNDKGHLGLTLDIAPYAIFYSNSVVPKVREQAERRNWGRGKKNLVIYIDLLTGLMDSHIYKLVHEKQELNSDIQDQIIAEEVRRWREN